MDAVTLVSMRASHNRHALYGRVAPDSPRQQNLFDLRSHRFSSCMQTACQRGWPWRSLSQMPSQMRWRSGPPQVTPPAPGVPVSVPRTCATGRCCCGRETTYRAGRRVRCALRFSRVELHLCRGGAADDQQRLADLMRGRARYYAVRDAVTPVCHS